MASTKQIGTRKMARKKNRKNREARQTPRTNQTKTAKPSWSRSQPSYYQEPVAARPARPEPKAYFAGRVAVPAPKPLNLRIGLIPQQHIAATQATALKPSTVKKLPPTKQAASTQKREPAQQSPTARDLNKKCKQRPEGRQTKRAGGSASKRWVPWCS